MKSGVLVQIMRQYAYVPIYSSPAGNSHPLAPERMNPVGRLEPHHLAIVVKKHEVERTSNFEVNEVEIVSEGGVCGFVPTYSLQRVSR